MRGMAVIESNRMTVRAGSRRCFLLHVCLIQMDTTRGMKRLQFRVQ